MKNITVKIAENLEISAYIIRTFEADDASDLHYILYCQNRLIDYMVYTIYKDWEEPLSELMESPDDILIEEDDEKLKYAHIRTLVDYCIIPELDK